MVFKAHYAPPRPQWGLTKTLLVMQLTAILLTVATLGVQAAGLAQTVTLTVKNAPLETVFKAIEHQTNFVVFAPADVVEEDRKVTLDLKNVPLSDALEACFKNMPY